MISEEKRKADEGQTAAQREPIQGDSASPQRRQVIAGESVREALVKSLAQRGARHKSDAELLGSTAAEVMENIEERYPEGEIGAVVVIAEVMLPEGDARVLTGTSDTKRHVVRGLIEVARDQMARSPID